MRSVVARKRRLERSESGPDPRATIGARAKRQCPYRELLRSFLSSNAAASDACERRGRAVEVAPRETTTASRLTPSPP